MSAVSNPVAVDPKKLSDRQCEALYLRARMAGLEAAQDAKVVPMVVNQHANVLNDNSPVVKSYFVESGVCGFAWVTIKPGNSRFANWMKEKGYARPDSYYGGVSYSVHEYGQSLQRKEAYARAFARVLSEAGINVQNYSRMD